MVTEVVKKQIKKIVTGGLFCFFHDGNVDVKKCGLLGELKAFVASMIYLLQ